MKNFEYTDYAINKANDDAIVYRFANGEVREITAADFGGDEEAFLRWKNFSDEDYHKEDNHNRSISRKNVSMSGIEETDLGSEKCFVEIEEMKEELEELQETVKLLFSCLSDTQKKRLYLSAVRGMSHEEISKIENCYKSSVTESIHSAKIKFEKNLKKFSKTPGQNEEKMAVSERVNFIRLQHQKEVEKMKKKSNPSDQNFEN